MSIAPDLTIRQSVSPYAILASISYVQSAPGGNNLPVLQGQNSDPMVLRLYNNWAQNSGIANAANIKVTVYDGSSAGSHTATKSIVNQEWMRTYETGYGENSSPPGLYTQFTGIDTAIGGVSSIYIPERGSNGGNAAQVRAGTNTNGVGFIELLTYAQVPLGEASQTWNFSISIYYEWIP